MSLFVTGLTYLGGDARQVARQAMTEGAKIVCFPLKYHAASMATLATHAGVAQLVEQLICNQ